MDLHDEALRWLEEAEEDLRAAAGVMEAGFYNWTCFIAQQAAEKAVKSLYVNRGEDVMRVHSVTALIRGDPRRELAGWPALSGYIEEAQELDQHYIPARYPNSVPFGRPHEFYNRRKAERCLACAQAIVSACRTILSPT
jgi:HEPN domain-containing protein